MRMALTFWTFYHKRGTFLLWDRLKRSFDVNLFTVVVIGTRHLDYINTSIHSSGSALYVQKFVASAFLGKLYTRCWNTALRSWLNSATRALVRSGTDVEWSDLDRSSSSQRFQMELHHSREHSSTAPQPSADHSSVVSYYNTQHSWCKYIIQLLKIPVASTNPDC